MAGIVLKDLVKEFGSFAAVKGINLEIRDGEFLILVGPSGCGKTTTLNMISGLVEPTAGDVVIGDRIVTHTEAGERGLGMVFQDLALFPHMTVFDNIAFGLRVKNVDAGEIRRRVHEAAEAMHIDPLLDKRPGQCSGGEAQRVALARTIVTNPSVYLMDEPLSSLDAKLRVDMRTELKHLHDQLGGTFVYVTHDQAEAMTMADRIAVMNAGRIEQVGGPLEIYRRPASHFVAGFFGIPTMNFLDGTVVAGDGRRDGISRHRSDRRARCVGRFRPRRARYGARRAVGTRHGRRCRRARRDPGDRQPDRAARRRNAPVLRPRRRAPHWWPRSIPTCRSPRATRSMWRSIPATSICSTRSGAAA